MNIKLILGGILILTGMVGLAFSDKEIQLITSILSPGEHKVFNHSSVNTSDTPEPKRLSSTDPIALNSIEPKKEEQEVIVITQDGYEFNAAKIESMKQARVHGDPRSPEITRPEYDRELPTPEELADPDLYLEYEARNTRKLYERYVEAADKKITMLEVFLADAKARGAKDEQLKEGYEKIEALRKSAQSLKEKHQL